VTDEMERTAYRRSVEQLLDLALGLRGRVTRDAGAAAVDESMRAIRELGARVERQRASLGASEAGDVVGEQAANRLAHVTTIMDECHAILEERRAGRGSS